MFKQTRTGYGFCPRRSISSELPVQADPGQSFLAKKSVDVVGRTDEDRYDTPNGQDHENGLLD